MENLFEILKIVLPAIITGIFTFIVTKDKDNNNKPVDKLEVAYNRVYYPIYKIIRETEESNISYRDVITKISCYFKKYSKYIDVSTKMAFQYLWKCDTETKKKKAYQRFKSNIYNENFYLRRKLGYLESGILQKYTYSPSAEKLMLRGAIEFCLMYVFLILAGITKNSIQIYCIAGLIIMIFVIIGEAIYSFAKFLYYKVRK